MSGDTLITVILTCYGLEHKFELFQQALQSVLTQSYQDFEVLVVDDCSPDNTQKLVLDYLESIHAKQKITYHRLTKNGGTSIARNEGIALCKTPLLSFLDYDDLYLPDYLVKNIEAFSDSSILLNLVGTYFYHKFGSSQKAHELEVSLSNLNEIPFLELAAYCLANNFPVAMGSGVACRRELFDKHPEMYFDEFLSKKTAEDVLFGYQALALGVRPNFIPEPQVVHRSYYKGNSRSTSAFLACDELEVYDYIFETAMQPVYNRIKQERGELVSDVENVYQKTRLNFELKNMFLEKEYLSSFSLVLENPKLAKSWLRFLLLGLSRYYPISFFRDWYLFSVTSSQHKAGSVVFPLIRNLETSLSSSD